MTIRVEHREAFDAGLREGWDLLASRAGARPFLRPGWIEALWQAFGSGRLDLLVATRGGSVAGVLPLMRLGGAVWSITNPHTPFFAPVGESREVLMALWREALRDRPFPLGVGFMEPPALEVLEEAARGRPVTRTVIARSPWVPLADGWEAYEARLAARRLREIRRRRRRLSDRGDLAIEVHDGRTDLERLLEDVVAVEGSGWKDEARTAIRAGADTRRFYRSVAAWAADRGWLRLAFLRLDGRPLAADLSLEEGGAHYLLKTGYDPAYAGFGPGLLLRHAMLERAFREGLDSYELLGTDDPWKREWADRVRPLLFVRVYPRTPAGLAARAWHGRLRPLLGRARRAARAVARR